MEPTKDEQASAHCSSDNRSHNRSLIGQGDGVECKLVITSITETVQLRGNTRQAEETGGTGGNGSMATREKADDHTDKTASNWKRGHSLDSSEVKSSHVKSSQVKWM